MLNYIKSEFYRIKHTKSVFICAGVLCALVVLFNLLLAFLNKVDPTFQYGTFRFSLNMFTGAPMTYMYVAGFVPFLLFLEDKRSGALFHTISCGISRRNIILGKGIVSFVTACVMMVVVLVCYAGSAWLLLENREFLPLQELLSEIVFLMPTAIAVMLLGIVLGMVLQKDMNVIWTWLIAVALVPNSIYILGLKFDFFNELSRWFPTAYFRSEIMVYFDAYECIWHTSEGIVRCLVSGLLGIVFVLVFGMLKVKKQDL